MFGAAKAPVHRCWKQRAQMFPRLLSQSCSPRAHTPEETGYSRATRRSAAVLADPVGPATKKDPSARVTPIRCSREDADVSDGGDETIAAFTQQSSRQRPFFPCNSIVKICTFKNCLIKTPVLLYSVLLYWIPNC